MSARVRRSAPALVLAALVLAPLPARAEDPPASAIPATSDPSQVALPDERFTLDVLSGWQGTGGVDDTAMFLKYQDIGEPFVLPRLLLRVHSWDTELLLDAVDVAEDDAVYRLGLRSPGLFSAVVGFDELPHHLADGARTLYSTGDDELLIANKLQRILQGSPFRLAEFLNRRAHSVDIETDRRTVRSKGSVSLVRGLTLTLEDEEEKRRGNLPRSVSTNFLNGADVNEFPDPIHYDTRRAGVALEYRFGPAWVAAQASLIEFSNRPVRLLVDNPLRFLDAEGGSFGNRSAKHFLLSTPPDNEAREFSANAGVALPLGMRITGSFARGRVTAPVNMLPYTSNSAVRDSVFYPELPSTFFDAKVKTTRYDLAFTGTPVRWFSFRAFARGYDYDNESPSYVFHGYVIADTQISTVIRRSLPYGWERKGQGVDLRFRPLPGLGIGAGFTHESVDRTFREVESSDEDGVRVAVDYTLQPWLDLHADVERSDRTADHYDGLAHLQSFPINGTPADQSRFRLLKRYDVATRERSGVGLSGAIDFGSGWGLDFASRQRTDDYSESDYGLVDEGFRSKLIGLSMKPNAVCQLRAELADEFGTRRLVMRFRPLLLGRPVDFHANDWGDEISNKMHTASGGLSCRDVDDRWDYNVWVVTSTDRQTDDATFTGRAVADPQRLGHAIDSAPITRHIQRYTGYVRFVMSRHLNMVLNGLYEKFDEEDLTQDIMTPTMANVDSAAFESAYLGVHVVPYSVRVFSILIDAHW